MATDTIHLDADLLAKISAAYDDGDSKLADRVRYVGQAIARGITGATIAADLKEAKLTDPTVNAVSPALISYAAAVAETLDAIGTLKFRASDIAGIHRAVRHVGVKSWRNGLKNVLANLTDAAPTERLSAVMDAAKTARETVVAPKAQTRPARPKSESGDVSADTGSSAGKSTVTESDLLAGIHAATRYLQAGGELTANWQNAIAQLTAAATAAGKRARQAA